MPLSSKTLEQEYLFNLMFIIHVHVVKLGGNPLALMPGRISALELMPGRISALALMPG